MHTQSDKEVLPGCSVSLPMSHNAHSSGPTPFQLPFTHAEQASDPVTVLSSPSSHTTHWVPSGPVYPARHVQSTSWTLPASEKVFAGQLIHSLRLDAPSVSLYVLTPHSRHMAAEEAPGLTEYVPGSHDVHMNELLAPGVSEYVPGTHGLHMSEEPAPGVSENVPGSHGKHTSTSFAPIDVEYVPATHDEHMD